MLNQQVRSYHSVDKEAFLMCAKYNEIVNKYAPNSLVDLLAIDNKSKELLTVFMEGFEKGNPELRGVLLEGEPGTGKTATPYAAAKQYGYEVLEINSSAVRSEEALVDRLQYTLSCRHPGEKTIILIDEVDGMVGQKKGTESGGAKYILAALKMSPVPIFLTANDGYKVKKVFGAALNKVCIRIKYAPIAPQRLRVFIKQLSVEQDLRLSEVEIMKISQLSRGDMRKVFELSFLPEGSRVDKLNSDANIWLFLDALFGSETPQECIDIYYNSDIKDVGAMYIWVCENLKNYNSSSSFLERAYAEMDGLAHLVYACVVERKYYLHDILVKTIIFRVKSVIGRGHDKWRKYDTPMEYQLGRQNSEILKIKKHLTTIFYRDAMSVGNFDANFKTMKVIFRNNRKYMFGVSIKVYQYVLVNFDDDKTRKEIFSKIMSYIFYGTIEETEKLSKLWTSIKSEESNKFALEVTSLNPSAVVQRKREVKKKLKEEVADSGSVVDLERLSDIDISAYMR
jgi:hypothetical protein